MRVIDRLHPATVLLLVGMFKNMKRQLKALALVGVFGVAGCGGSGSSTLTSSEIDQFRSDPRVVRANGIIERADTLLIPGAYYDVTITAQGRTDRQRLTLDGTCSGTRCVLSDGVTQETMTLEDLLAPADTDLTSVALGERGGFDTMAIEGRIRLSRGTITGTFSATAFGVWGEHGFAAVEMANGPFSGRVQGVSFSGSMIGAASYSIGDVNRTNPTGLGSATWRGVAEAASTRTFERRQGTSRITIRDLSNPRVDVDIEVAGYEIGSPAWDSIPLSDGHFAAGSNGRDRVEGNFHGPGHKETYGVFDTGAYIGVFGAKR